MLKKPKMEEPNDIGLNAIQKEVKRLQARATTLQSQAIVRTDANMEKTASVVDVINISTQSIERMTIEELCPAIIETHNLVRETHWKVGAFALAQADIQNSEIANLEPGTYEDPLDSWCTLRKGEKAPDINIGILREEVIRPMVKLQLQVNSINPEHWGEIDYPYKTVRDFLFKQTFKIILAYSDRPAWSTWELDVRLSPQKNKIRMNLFYVPREAPRH